MKNDNGNLTITEALLTGLPFRRSGWSTWVKPHWQTAARYDRNGKCQYFRIEDLRANDWEVECEKPIKKIAELENKIEKLEREICTLKAKYCHDQKSKCDNFFLKL